LQIRTAAKVISIEDDTNDHALYNHVGRLN
jgi:hypothetical protein